ncbi:MAG: hypothetical protein MZV65_00185 [Chromatiales bacterium]|nr:hypothetical protein [Chromatiales bacterium]
MLHRQRLAGADARSALVGPGGQRSPSSASPRPDLALTQLLVEVVTVVLMLLALHCLPQRVAARAGHRPARWRDGAGRAGGRRRASRRWPTRC